MRKFIIGAAAVALAALSSIPVSAPAKAQPYFWGGRDYCWYDGGWHGPGWYWCGYAWRRGFGWGGPHGWRGWARGGGHGGGYGGGRGGHGGGHGGGHHH